MNLNAIQTAAKAKGQLIFAMDQGQQNIPTMSRAGFGANDDGYCMGLSTLWIAEMYAGRTLPFNSFTQTYEDVNWTALDLQERYGAIPDAAKDRASNGWKDAAALLSMRLSPGLFAEQYFLPPTGRFICNTARRAWGCYGITLSAKRGVGGNHAIAVRHARDNTFHLFDPNNGHFAVKWVDKFQTFLDGYFQATGYDQRYQNIVSITGVRPPIGQSGPSAH